MSISKKLYKIAINDLNSVSILYDSKHYNLALFQLQQSVEKFVKSYGILTKIIKVEDLAKKISHLPHKVFSRKFYKQIDELTKPRIPNLIPDMVPPHQRGKSRKKEDIDGLKKLLSKINNAHLSEIKYINKEEIEEFIEQATDFDKEHIFDEKKLFKDFKEDFVKTNEHFKEYFKDFGDKYILENIDDSLENPDEKVRTRIENYKYKVRQEQKFIYIAFVWVNLSLITSPHEQSTRYPSITSDETPNQLYTEKNPLIKYMPKFVEIMKKSINKYTEIVNEIKPMHNK